MFSNFHRRMKDNRGFNMIELMVVVVIIGILAAIAVPIYSKYAKNARITEATGRMGDILTAAKSYAIEFDTANDVTKWNWPDTEAAPNFIGNTDDSENFTYALVGTDNGNLVITATGVAKMDGTSAVLTVTGGPTKNGTIVIDLENP